VKAWLCTRFEHSRIAYIAYVAKLALHVKQENATVLSWLMLFALCSLLENPLSIRHQTNVSLSPAIAEKMERFAKIFHRGEFAPVARVLIEEALRHIATEDDYLQAMKRSAVDDEKRPSGQLEATHGKSTRRK
jgi:hypothetical protein